ncbi:Holliday junction resolvase RuvX [Kistimonas scapharcae]|uniref:Putative pre-16S rRNA nuclease n=1 Tax=Kistimonas scapharcae TaxID=1036133 RepID=A0ABP8V7P5_9GAMM
MKAEPARTLMAFDYGTRNIGVAIGQSVTGTATALPGLKARDGIPDWQQVKRLIDEWQPDAFVIGMPLNMDGTESEMSQRARKFGNRLYGRFGKAWHAADERLSTYEAKEWAGRLGHTGSYGDNPVDSMAAQMILESWMNDPANACWLIRATPGS